MKKLLVYYFKKRLPVMGIVIGIMSAILIFYMVTVSYIGSDWNYNELTGQYIEIPCADNSPLGWITFYACVLATIIPIMEFRFKMTKISVDLYYQLPVKRGKLFLTKYILGLVEVVVPIIVCYLLVLISILGKDNMFEIKYLFAHLFGIIFGSVLLYTTFTFVYNRCNTIVDGIINMFLYVFVLIPIMAIINKYIDFYEGSFAFLYSPIVSISSVTNNLFLARDLSRYDFNTFTWCIIIFSVIAIISFVLFYKFAKEDKAENSMQISNSYFGSKVLIPLYMFTTLFLIGEDNLLYPILIGALGYALYVAHARTFKIGKKNLIILLVSVVVGFMLGLIV